jgi:hypothetical protein
MLQYRGLAAGALLVLAAATAPVLAAPRVPRPAPAVVPASAALSTFVNLDYANERISTFAVAGGMATEIGSFRIGSPAKLSTNGIAVDASGAIYTAVNAAGAKPCFACVEVLQPDGNVLTQIPAPSLGGSLQPSLGDLALDATGNVYVADSGQQAAYFYTPSASGFAGPTVIESGASTASIAVSPNGKNVFVSGNCGFASVRPYTRAGHGYTAGACFAIGTIALIGGSADDAGDVATPVDGARGLVSISNPNGCGSAFSVPDPDAEVGSVSFSPSAALLYVADHNHEQLYAFARPAAGWCSKAVPPLVDRYTGFAQLDIVATAR